MHFTRLLDIVTSLQGSYSYWSIAGPVKRFKITDEVPFRVQLSWLNLSFTAGAINAGGFLSCQSFVSHVTGFVTISGLNFEQKAWVEALSALSIPGFFLGGAVISGILTEYEQNDAALSRRFGYAMGVIAMTLGAIIVFGIQGLFGPFGLSEKITTDFLLIALLCGICGLQNAAVTSLTGASVRPTHLTGTTTDLGLGLVRALRAKSGSSASLIEHRTNRRRLGLIVAFVTGVMVGSSLFFELEYLGFALPLVTTLISMVESIVDVRSTAKPGAK